MKTKKANILIKKLKKSVKKKYLLTFFTLKI